MKDRYEQYLEKRNEYFQRIQRLNRRDFIRASGVAAAGAVVSGTLSPHSFQPVDVQAAGQSFRFAYISDSHLYERKVNDRFVRSMLRAVDDVNAARSAAGLRPLRRRPRPTRRSLRNSSSAGRS
jgi:Icc protein